MSVGRRARIATTRRYAVSPQFARLTSCAMAATGPSRRRKSSVRSNLRTARHDRLHAGYGASASWEAGGLLPTYPPARRLLQDRGHDVREAGGCQRTRVQREEWGRPSPPSDCCTVGGRCEHQQFHALFRRTPDLPPLQNAAASGRICNPPATTGQENRVSARCRGHAFTSGYGGARRGPGAAGYGEGNPYPSRGAAWCGYLSNSAPILRGGRPFFDIAKYSGGSISPN